MKNKNKGFTLIELLVVVAIIGILAAVGTVAYTGYTASAKKNASKTLQSQAVKYLAAEIQKCTLESSGTAIEGNIDCDDSDAAAATAYTAANYAKFYKSTGGVKNPYKPTTDGVTIVTAAPAAPVEGQLYLLVSGDNITVSILAKTGDDVLSNTVTVE